MKISILNFSYALIIMTLFFACHSCNSVPKSEWYKGQLHCHSAWSDGNTLPELAISWYKDRGYHFVCLSDHGILQLDPDRWKGVSQSLIDESNKKFGNDWCETKIEDDKTLVRLKTYEELAQKLNEDGKFLLIPGHEQNARVNGLVLHANAINITETIPFPNKFSTTVEAALAWRNASLENSTKNNLEGFWMLNHPYWPYYDVIPEVLIEAADIDFYEFRNVSAAPEIRHEQLPDEEKFWDVVNAFRILNGKNPVYGIATDDTHDYLTFRVQHSAIPGDGWIVVRSEKLDANSLIQSMKKGDFYASTGVVLKDIRFNPAKRTLKINVEPKGNEQYTIRFVGTKKGFDTGKKVFEIPEEGKFSERTGFTYSDQIGVTFQTTVGNTATYKMSPDDLYVRAIITSNKLCAFPSVNKPDLETAWTQPVGWGERK